MCLSTPIAAAANNNASTNAVSCNSSCVNHNNNSNNNNGICALGAVTHCGPGDNSNSVSIRNRFCTNNNNNNNIKQDEEEEEEEIADEQSKDLGDNLGYKEENAVYKEVPQTTTSSKEALSTNASSGEIEYNPHIRWPDLIAQVFLHGGALYGIYLLFQAKFYTFLWGKRIK